jgi:hypothetical protein
VKVPSTQLTAIFRLVSVPEATTPSSPSTRQTRFLGTPPSPSTRQTRFLGTPPWTAVKLPTSSTLPFLCLDHRQHFTIHSSTVGKGSIQEARLIRAERTNAELNDRQEDHEAALDEVSLGKQ